MKKSSRKRLLISSVAMLLVAMLALGTATYAWFTSNRTVTAQGMSVKAAAAKGLQITKDNGANWANSVIFAEFSDKTLKPVSLGYTSGSNYNKLGTPYYVNEAKQDGKWNSTDTAKFVGWNTTTLPTIPATGEAKVTSGYFIAYEVGIKSTGDAISNVTAKVEYVAPTGSVTDGASFIRIAVLDQTGTAVNWTTDTIKTVMGNEASPEAITAATPAVTAQKLDAITDSGVSFAIAGTITSTPKYYSVLVWFEGQDGDCVDDAQAAEGNVKLTFSYT